jgi:hypothetical protein
VFFSCVSSFKAARLLLPIHVAKIPRFSRATKFQPSIWGGFDAKIIEIWRITTNRNIAPSNP